MTATFFAAAAIVAVSVVAWRRLRSQQQRTLQRSRTGNNADRPLAVKRFDEIDTHVRAEQCWRCSGTLSVVSEGSRSVGAHAVRVVHAECARCEAAQDFFFDLSHIAH